jgi:hypothetical protein
MTKRNLPKIEISPELIALHRRGRDRQEGAAKALEARVTIALTEVFVRQLRGLIAIIDAPQLGPAVARAEIVDMVEALSGKAAP